MRSIDILIKNILRLLDQEENPSMMGLSLNIGASQSYIQKVTTYNLNPSFDKIDAICRYFNISGWELFCDLDEDRELLSVVQMIQGLPEDMLPPVYAYVTYLANTYGDGKKKKSKSRSRRRR